MVNGGGRPDEGLKAQEESGVVMWGVSRGVRGLFGGRWWKYVPQRER